MLLRFQIIMTGNLQKLGALLSLLLLRRKVPDAMTFATKLAVAAVLSTILGALAGALLLRIAPDGKWLFLPIAALQVIAISLHIASCSPDSAREAHFCCCSIRVLCQKCTHTHTSCPQAASIGLLYFDPVLDQKKVDPPSAMPERQGLSADHGDVACGERMTLADTDGIQTVTVYISSITE